MQCQTALIVTLQVVGVQSVVAWDLQFTLVSGSSDRELSGVGVLLGVICLPWSAVMKARNYDTQICLQSFRRSYGT